MRDIDDDYPSLDVFDAIHRELVTIIGHCTFHRSVLQDLLLRSANETEAPEETLQRWRDESIASVDKLRFSDLNKQDKTLATRSTMNPRESRNHSGTCCFRACMNAPESRRRMPLSRRRRIWSRRAFVTAQRVSANRQR